MTSWRRWIDPAAMPTWWWVGSGVIAGALGSLLLYLLAP